MVRRIAAAAAVLLGSACVVGAQDGLIVKFREGVDRRGRDAAVNGMGMASRTRHFSDRLPGAKRRLAAVDRLSRVELRRGVSLQRAMQALAARPEVEYVEPDLIVHALATPNDAEFRRLYGLHNTGQTGGLIDADLDAPEAWDLSVGSRDVIVAVIDTGVDYDHVDLAANMWRNPGEIPNNGVDDDANGFVDDVFGYDFANDDADPDDDNRHGTHCSGTIGAVGDNGIGVAGVCWQVSIMAVKFLRADGSGSTSDAIAAIQYAVANGADVLSNSWGGSGSSRALADAVLAADRAGVVVVAAAGNSGNSTPNFPAAHPGVLAVAATDHTDRRASFSNFGSYVDLAAPGVNILSTTPNDGLAFLSGTSMATPHVAGLAALIKARNPALNGAQITEILLATVDDLGAPGRDDQFGAGRINARAALVLATPPAGLPAPSLLLPANASSTQDTTPDFDWSDVPGAATYRIEASLNGQVVLDVPGLATSAYTPADPLPLGAYTWRVRALDANAAAGAFSAPFALVIAPANDVTPPSAPVLLEPTNGGVTADTTPTLRWGAVVDPSGVTYELQLDDDPNFGSPAVNLTGLAVTQLTVSQALAPATYSWRVRARDGANNLSAYTGATFVVAAGDVTGPTLAFTSPTDGATITGRRLTVTANAADPSGVARVDFALDDRTVASDGRAPYGFRVGTRRLRGRTIRITATAYDTLGNASQTTISVTFP